MFGLQKCIFALQKPIFRFKNQYPASNLVFKLQKPALSLQSPRICLQTPTFGLQKPLCSVIMYVCYELCDIAPSRGEDNMAPSRLVGGRTWRPTDLPPPRLADLQNKVALTITIFTIFKAITKVDLHLLWSDVIFVTWTSTSPVHFERSPKKTRLHSAVKSAAARSDLAYHISCMCLCIQTQKGFMQSTFALAPPSDLF